MGTIRAKIANDRSNQYREFRVVGYAKPAQSVRWGNYYVERVLAIDNSEGVWYLNTSGYAQLFDEKRPPFAGNSVHGLRLMLVPTFDEPAVLAEIAAQETV